MTPQEHAAIEALLRVATEQAVASEAALVSEYEGILDASADANLDDEHDPEGATVGYERARVASLLGQVRARVSALAAAGDRLRAGVYGTCAQCGQDIAFDRLMAFPTSTTCISCANGPRPRLRTARANVTGSRNSG